MKTNPGYLNTGFLGAIFESKDFESYYSIVTKKELLSKRGLKEAERQAILFTLKQHRIIPLNNRIATRYSELRRKHPFLEKEDALIARNRVGARPPATDPELEAL